MAVVPLTSPYVLKSATFVVVADDYTAAVSQVQFDPAVTPAKFTGIGGNVVKDIPSADWTVTLGLAQDLAPGSLHRYLLANQGTTKAVQFIPKAGGPTINASLVIMPATIGGTADGNIVLATVQLPVNGAPVFVDTPAAPIITSALPSGAAAGAQITIRGTGFTGTTGATGVKVGGVNATSYVALDDFTIVAVVPAGTAGSAPITVTSPVGTSTGFAYTRA